MRTNGRSARGLSACKIQASRSLPLPGSPRTRTVEAVRAMDRASWINRTVAGSAAIHARKTDSVRSTTGAAAAAEASVSSSSASACCAWWCFWLSSPDAMGR